LNKGKDKTVNYISKKIKGNDTDWWDKISDAEKTSILRGLKDIKAGRITPHDEVRKKYLKWLNK